jgi:hypothetical protein
MWEVTYSMLDDGSVAGADSVQQELMVYGRKIVWFMRLTSSKLGDNLAMCYPAGYSHEGGESKLCRQKLWKTNPSMVRAKRTGKDDQRILLAWLWRWWDGPASSPLIM